MRCSEKEGLFIAPRMIEVTGGKARLIVGVVHVVSRVVGVDLPTSATVHVAVIEAIPDFDLDKDVVF